MKEQIFEFLSKKIDEVREAQLENESKDSGYDYEKAKFISGQLNILNELFELYNKNK